MSFFFIFAGKQPRINTTPAGGSRVPATTRGAHNENLGLNGPGRAAPRAPSEDHTTYPTAGPQVIVLKEIVILFKG